MSYRGRGGSRGRNKYSNSNNYSRDGNSDCDRTGNRGGAPDDRNSRESGGHSHGRGGGHGHNHGRDNGQRHGRGDGHNHGRDNGQTHGHDDLSNKCHNGNGAPPNCIQTIEKQAESGLTVNLCIQADAGGNTSFEDIVSTVRPVLMKTIANKGYISFDVKFDQPEGRYQGDHHKQSRAQKDMGALLEATVTGVNPDAFISFYQPQYLILVKIVGSNAYISVITTDKKSTQQGAADQ